jgi:ABC-2 type transport system permease protein
MDLHNAWTVTWKELRIFRKRRSVIYATVLFPLVVSIGLPAVVQYAGSKSSGGISKAILPGVLDAFAFFFIIGAAVLPIGIASYSLVGEKVQKSLEPLLATPVSDGEILLGKIISAFIPSIVAIYAGALVFMALIDRETAATLGYSYFPNWNIGVILLVAAPLAALLSIELCIVVSTRMSDVRSVQQIGGLMVFPYAGIYVATEVGAITLTTDSLLAISVVILLADAGLFYLSRAIFSREKILTTWK